MEWCASSRYSLLAKREVLLPSKRSAREATPRRWQRVAEFVEREGGNLKMVSEAIHTLHQRELVVHAGRLNRAVALAAERDCNATLSWFEGDFPQAKQHQMRAELLRGSLPAYDSIRAHRFLDWAAFHAAEYHRSGASGALQQFTTCWLRALQCVVPHRTTPLGMEFLEDALWRRHLYHRRRSDDSWTRARREVGEAVRSVIDTLPHSEQRLTLAREVAVYLQLTHHRRLSPKLWTEVPHPAFVRQLQ